MGLATYLLLSLALFLGSCPTPNPEARTGESKERLIGELTLSVKESDADVDTGLDVLMTDRLVINASGKIWAGVAFTGENGPRGWNNIDNDLKFPLPGTHPFSLLGKIGTQYFYLGDGSQVTHPIANGRLLLRINDDTPGNGNGAFAVRIALWRTS